MGSDNFSEPILESLLSRGGALEAPVRVVGVVTQPDRPSGRGRRRVVNPVKAHAVEGGIPILQPERIRDLEAVESVLALDPELVIVASYGQIVPAVLLHTPKHKALNLHPSLLPRYRGPSPIVGPILAGDTETGTTLMLMAPKMDAGPIVDQLRTEIGEKETAGELQARLAKLSAEMLLSDLPRWVRGEMRPREQDERSATYTSKVTKADGEIDWSMAAETIERRLRAYSPWPSAYTFWAGRQIKVLEAEVGKGSGQPGVVAGLRDGALQIGTGDGSLAVERIQLAGGRPASASEVARGHPELLGARLGS